MKNHLAARTVLAVILLVTTPGTLLLTGCIGTAGASSVTLSINPFAPTNVLTGATQQFNVSENGEIIATGVTWEVNGIVGGNTTIGTISSTGLYTAPLTVPNPATVQVGATEPGLSESLVDQVTITSPGTTPAPTANISVSPSVITPGSNATLAWSCTNSTSATINQSSVLNGIQVGTVGSTTVSPTATTPYQLNCTGPNGSASMTVTLTVQTSTTSPVAVSISPTSGTFASNITVPFSAVVVNDSLNAGVHWTSSFDPAPVPTGILTANYLTPSFAQAQAVQITAYSVTDPNASATATIIVDPISGGGGGTGGGGTTCTSPPASQHPPQPGVSPELVSMTAGTATQQPFVASLTGDNVTSDAWTWSLKSVQSVTDLGTVIPASSDSHEVLYQPPATAPYPLLTVELVATSQLYTCLSANAVIQVTPPE